MAALCACDQGGSSTREVKEAAADRARQQLGLPADVPLETTVWTGQPFNGELTVCGTVTGPASQQVRPQRFIATTEPFRWRVFEDAQGPTLPSKPEMFPEWSRICAGRGPAVGE